LFGGGTNSKTLYANLGLWIERPCKERGPNDWVFPLGRTVTLRTGNASYTAVWDSPAPFVEVPASGPAVIKGGKLMAYHAVFAALMQELGFESFESASGTPFQSFADNWEGVIGSNQEVSSLIGVAGRR